MKKALFTGCCTALVTPFSGDGIDEGALKRLVSLQLEDGVSALLACGTTGEPSVLSDREWERVVACVLEETDGRVPVLAGTGGNDTARVIALAGKAAALGASAQLCVTPYYNKTSQAGLVAHFTAIADAGSLPIILYNVPSRTGLSITPESLARLSEHDNIIAIKEASADLVHIGEMMGLCSDQLVFYSGTDEVVVPMMALGALGVISVLSNVAPALTSRMAEAMLKGDYPAAAALQLRLFPLIRALFSEVNPIPLKAAMGMMGLCENRLRLPLVPLDPARVERLWAALRELELVR